MMNAGNLPAGYAIPAHRFRSYTHTTGISETVELARALDQLPRRLIVFGIEGKTLGTVRDSQNPFRRP